MSWNYRVIEFVAPGNGEPWRSIHEVYYDDEGKPIMYQDSPAHVTWDTEEGVRAPQQMLKDMGGALLLPVLVEADFEPQQEEFLNRIKKSLSANSIS
jgi:hypothetical protein